jgi:hypothetical protein
MLFPFRRQTLSGDKLNVNEKLPRVANHVWLAAGFGSPMRHPTVETTSEGDYCSTHMDKPKSKAQQEAEEWVDPYPKKKTPYWRWLGTSVLLLVVYVLSLGPMSLLYSKGIVPQSVFKAIYVPLAIAGRSSPAFDALLDSYVSLFGK